MTSADSFSLMLRKSRLSSVTLFMHAAFVFPTGGGHPTALRCARSADDPLQRVEINCWSKIAFEDWKYVLYFKLREYCLTKNDKQPRPEKAWSDAFLRKLGEYSVHWCESLKWIVKVEKKRIGPILLAVRLRWRACLCYNKSFQFFLWPSLCTYFTKRKINRSKIDASKKMLSSYYLLPTGVHLVEKDYTK